MVDLARCRWMTALALGLVGAAASSTCARSQSLRQDVWGTDGNVIASLRYGGTLYVAGAFNSVGPVTGGGVPVDPVTGEPCPAYPRVCGTVRAVIGDGNGGWYIGGTFTGVGSIPCANLAHITSFGTLAAWYPSPDGEVDALAIHAGRLFVGGQFHSIGGQARSYIASVDLRTGAATTFGPSVDGFVRALYFAPTGLYVGGDFTSFGGQTRHGAAKLDSSLATVAPWNPDANFAGVPGTVRAIATARDTVYLGGFFFNLGTSQHQNLAAVSSDSGLAFAWAPSTSGPNDSYWGDAYVNTLAVDGGTILVGGHFTTVSGMPRVGLAQVDRATGDPTAWNPAGVDGGAITAILIDGGRARIGGFFNSMGGQPRFDCGEVDLSTGVATAWNPHVNDAVFGLAAGPHSVYVGGVFTGAGSAWQPRRNLAALDLNTGQLKNWKPNPDGLIIYALAATHGQVYAGGIFDSIGAQQRVGLAALDTLTGSATGWSANTNDVVTSLLATGDTLIVAGNFTTIGATARRYLAAIDVNSGLVTAWNPDPNDLVNQITAANGSIYACGAFTAIGASARSHIAAIDPLTGLATAWNPSADDLVSSVAVGRQSIFACGAFQTIGGKPRGALAALDPVSGNATTWTADINSRFVNTLAILGDTLFVGGGFTAIAGQPRSSLAAVDAVSGSVLAWDPALGDVDRGSGSLNPVVWSLTLDGSTLDVGGFIGRSGVFPVSGIAAFDFLTSTPGPGRTPRLAMAPIWPNPVRVGQSVTARVNLAQASPVTLDIFDALGRRVARILDREAMPSGDNAIDVRIDGLRTGFYFVRADAGPASATRKLVIFR